MIVKGININNQQIHIENVSMDFSKKGIYLIRGDVGCGKTSFIEKILFESNELVFEKQQYYDLYEKNRYLLFAYVPQNIVSLDMRVKDMLPSTRLTNNNRLLGKYLAEFDLEEDILEKQQSALSGGERSKIAIIGEILKETPYLFLDEPTNNLDNQSVQSLIKILNSLKNERTIIVISHDERFQTDFAGQYNIENGTDMPIEKKTKETCDNKAEKQEEIKNIDSKKEEVNYVRILSRATKSFSHYIALFFFLMVMIYTAIYSYFEFISNYNSEKLIEDNIILCTVFESYDELNRRYAEEKNLTIKEEDYEKNIPIDYVKSIAASADVEAIYLKDDKYIDGLIENLSMGTYTQPLIFACPDILFGDLYEISSIDFDFSYVYGKLPEDDKAELTTSLDVLNKYYQCSFTSEEDAIGNIVRINVNGELKEYLIAGIIDSDVVILSYEDELNIGYYRYREDTFDDFAERQKNYCEEQDAGDCYADEMIIKTVDGHQERLINSLMQLYPATQYYCNSYIGAWQDSYNRERFYDVLWPNIILSIIFAVMLVLVNRSSLKYNYYLIRYYENYYIDRKRVRKMYRIFTFYQYIIVVAVILILNTMISPFCNLSNVYILVDAFIIVLPLIISHYFIGRMGCR